MSSVTAPQDTHAGLHPSHGDDHHAHGDHPPFLAHHFETPVQQFDAAKLGMWLFLVTEVLFFGGLFVWYAVLRSNHPEMFRFASGYLNTLMGGLNTCVLILSSLTMALAVRFAQTNRKGALIACLWLTFAGAAGFLVIKYFEYTHKFEHNLKWGPGFYYPSHHGGGEAHGDGHAIVGHGDAAPAHPAFEVPAHGDVPSGSTIEVARAAGAPPVQAPAVEASAIAPAAVGPGGVKVQIGDEMPEYELVHEFHPRTGAHLASPELPPNTHQFFGVYYAMTGLHGIHVVVGMIVIGWLILRAYKGHFTSQYYTPVDLGGLYWHIVDLVWIFLFPLFYIIH